MNPNMAFYAVNTKIATKKGRILSKGDWNKFIECGSVEQLADLLKNNVEFAKAFKDADSSESQRVNLETILGKFRRIEVENLLHYFSGDYKEFLKTFLVEEEINDLSLIIRKLSREESLDGIKDRFIHSELFETLDFDDLLTATSIDQLSKKLKGTAYYSGLNNLTKEDALKRDFHTEMKLYMAYYRSLFDRAEKLDKEDRNAAKEIIGFKIDLLNIQWIFRALKYYSISSEEIFIYSLEGGKIIDYSKLKKLCYSQSIDEFKGMVQDFLKYDLFKNLNDAEMDINVVIDYYMFDYLKTKKYHNIGIVISFVYLLDIIVNDLTSITEGIQYNVPKDKLKEYLAFNI